jgi:hypothetical protein
MKNRILLAVVALMATACGPFIRITVSIAPTATFSAYHRFTVLTPPQRQDGRQLAGDPMLINSMTNRLLQMNVTDAFIGRGYQLDSASPDFKVAYYASARERLDVTLWNYGYPGRWGGWYPEPGYATAVPYAEGTVIVDVVDAKTNELLWRGRSQVRSSDDPAEFEKDLRGAVQSIVHRFPLASNLATATR